MKYTSLLGKFSLAFLLFVSLGCKGNLKSDSNSSSIETTSTVSESDETQTVEGQSTDVSYDQLLLPAKLTDRAEQILKRTGYMVSFNKDMRLPNWVAWHLTAEHATGSSKRDGIKFEEDTDVPSPRATHADYIRSGFDRGHMCPAGDNKWSDKAMKESFLMTNICPQHPNLNRGDWNEMENACRDWAKEYGDLIVIAGPIFYNQNHKKIGKNKVVVPEAFFKVVLTLGDDEPKAVGFIYKNNKGNRSKDSYVNSVDDVERITGIDFFPALPDDIENKIEKYKKLL